MEKERCSLCSAPTEFEETHFSHCPIADVMYEALQSILNIEGPALRGIEFKAFEGLDVDWHFQKVRNALAKAEGR